LAYARWLDADTALDITQEAFLRLWKQWDDGVTIVNNRGTSQRDNDLSLFTPGPVYYQDDLQRIWTKEVVRLTDLQSQPRPTTITATGMDVYLVTESVNPAQPPQPKKTKPTSISGVDHVVLRSDVDMHLWVDARSGFLGSGKEDKKPKSGTGKGPDGKPAPAAQSTASGRGDRAAVRSLLDGRRRGGALDRRCGDIAARARGRDACRRRGGTQPSRHAQDWAARIGRRTCSRWPP